MAFVGNYSTPANGGAAMVSLYTRLKAAGWTITNESNHLLLGAAFDGSAGSWFAAKEPGAGTRSWCVQAETPAGANFTKWYIKYAAATFIGGAPAATVVPSAAGEVVLIGAGPDAGPTFSQILAADGAYRWCVACDSASPYGWHATAFMSGGVPDTNARTHIMYDPLLTNSYPAGDTRPYVARAGYAVVNLGNVGTYSDGATTPFVADSMKYAKNVNGTWETCGLGLINFGIVVLGSGGEVTVEPYTSFEQRAMVLYARDTEGLVGYSSMLTIGGKTTGRVTGDVLQVGTSYFLRMDYVYLPWDSTVVVI